MKILFFIFTLLITSLSQANGISEGTKREIEHLFNYMETSGCEFSRNGIWYNAADASQHIRKKYDYLIKEKQVTTAESFIEKAASESSMSGRPYEVRCEGKAVIHNSTWFNAELKKFRDSNKR